jgi:HEAT repeats
VESGKRFRAGAVVVLVAAAMGALAWGVFHPREPRYQGRTATEWIEEVAARADTNALTAVQRLGTNALPLAIRKMERDDSRWRLKYAELWRKLPRLLTKVLPEPNRRRLVGVVNVFILIGHQSVPFAIGALEHDDPVVREEAASGLTYFTLGADETGQALPALIKALRDSDASVRVQAAGVLGKLGADASNAVPALTTLLEDHARGQIALAPGGMKLPIPGFGSDVQFAAMQALGKIGPPARGAVPALTALLRGKDAFTSGKAAVALWRIEHDTDVSLQPLLSVLDQPSAAWHYPDWIATLGEMGPRAKDAVPFLARLVQSHDQAGPAALSALRRIDPEAAELLSSTNGPLPSTRLPADLIDMFPFPPGK